MSTPIIRITSEGMKAKVTIDGEKIAGISEIKYVKSSGELPKLVLEFVGCEVEIDGDFVPGLPKVYDRFYEVVAKKPSND